MTVRLSIVSFDAYPLLDPTASGGIGGAEVRAVTFAKGLQQIGGYGIEFIVRARPDIREEGSGFRIRAYEKSRPSALSRLQRSLEKRFAGRPHADRYFSQLATDVLLCFGVRNDTGSIIRAAKEAGKRTVLFLTSDRNIEDAMRTRRNDRGIYGELGHLCKYAIKTADRIVVQTPYQLDELRTQLDVQGHLIRNPISLDRTEFHSGVPQSPVALWVGRADTFSKRADLCIEIARRCPEVQFRMVMNNHDSDTFDSIQQSAPSNVEIVERVPFEKIESYFANATVLINTSAAEGFPNSFLQAAKYGKPIVSLQVDPGDMFASFGCGHCADGDLDRMAGEIDRLCENTDEYEKVSTRIEQYVTDYHDAAARCEELDDLLTGLRSSLRSSA